ncbi:MAG: amidohydrolase [Robiginitomaculum sp.]|nr:amidohydrolase [Robiginitomaculum sp.]
MLNYTRKLLFGGGLFVLGACTPAEQFKSEYTLITNGQVLTMNQNFDIMEDGCVVVRGAKIESVFKTCDGAAYPNAQIIDAEGGIVMPGMINLHNHLSMVAFRGLAESGVVDVHDRLYNYFFPLEKQLLNRNLIRVSARHAAIEMALGGVTTTTDMYYHEDEVAKSVKEVGLRGVLGETVIGFPVVDAPKIYGGLEYARGFIESWKDDELITPAVAPHAPYSVSPEMLLKSKALADEYNVPLILHMAEMVSEKDTISANFPNTTQNKSVVKYLDDIGFLGANVLAAHVIYIDDADMEILKARGVGVSHNPKANTKDSSGMAPAWAARAAGVDMGLGTDGPMSSNQLDILNVMNYAARVARIESGEVSRFEPRELVQMATIGGAQALDMADKIGSLKPGKLADIIIIETGSPNMQPNYNPYATLAFAAYPSNVILTMVNGDIVARDGKAVNIDMAIHQAEWDKVTDEVAAFAKTLKPTN